MTDEQRGDARPGLLCVANYEAGTGFAWTFIERVYAEVADRLADRGIATWVAYPELGVDPEPLQGSEARPVELAVRLNDPSALPGLVDWVRRRKIRTMYLADRETWHPSYAALRMAGIRRIVVHDHTSGERTRPRGVKRAVKWATRRIPGMLADRVIAVSDFVVRRKTEVDLVPPERVERVWNAVDVSSRPRARGRRLAEEFGVPEDRPVIVCACRAVEEKGVQHLLRAFREVLASTGGDSARPLLVYMGDGPALETWKSLAEELEIGDDVVFTGYRDDVTEVLTEATMAVVPSVWAEAFGLAALEPMAVGIPVVASRVGGIPEVVEDGETGLLVPPGDPSALAGAISHLLADDDRRSEMGRNARERVERHFSWDRQVTKIASLLEEGFA